MENSYSNEQLEKIKELVQTIEDMKLTEPYKTETYKMMLAQVLGKSILPQISGEDLKQDKPIKSQEKKQKSGKIGRGNKSDLVMKAEELLNTDFFSSQRTMREFQDRLKELGYNADLTKISPILLFFVREQKLKRIKNEHKRFVYFKE